MKADLNNVEEIFNKMHDNGFDINLPLKWGFYFFDTDKSKLQIVFDELRDKGYQLENLSQVKDNEWRLFVSKVEVLSPEKLHRRNIAFNELAEYCHVDLYDGWEVERI